MTDVSQVDTLFQFLALAKRNLSPGAWDYLMGGSDFLHCTFVSSTFSGDEDGRIRLRGVSMCPRLSIRICTIAWARLMPGSLTSSTIQIVYLSVGLLLLFDLPIASAP